MRRGHIAVPMRVEHGRIATVEDGSLDEIEQNVKVILGTRVGERLMLPDFGIDSPVFDPVTMVPNEGEIEAAVAEWEPRAAIAFVPQTTTDDGTVRVVIHVSRGVG